MVVEFRVPVYCASGIEKILNDYPVKLLRKGNCSIMMGSGIGSIPSIYYEAYFEDNASEFALKLLNKLSKLEDIPKGKEWTVLLYNTKEILQ